MSAFTSELGRINMEVACPEELAVVMGLLDECAAWLYSRGIAQWASPQPPHEWEKMRLQIALGQVYLARLESERQLIGTVRIEWEDAKCWPDDPCGGGYVHSLAIRGSFRGHQIGAGLLSWAEEEIAGRGRRYIRLDCWDKNPVLCRYYENRGFRRCGSFEDRGWIGALYEKEVGPAQP